MIVPDSSVLVAGFVPSHQFHADVLPSLGAVKHRGSLVSHTIAETFSVLSAPGGIYRAEARSVVEYLDQFLENSPAIPVPAHAYSEALEILVGDDRAGGVVYDAVIAIAARDLGATLLSLDRRAEPIYELCGAGLKFLG